MEVTYGLKYKISIDTNEGKGFTKEELLKSSYEDPEVGGCDALIIYSIKRPNGEFHIHPMSVDSLTNSTIIIREHFKAWFLMAAQMSEDEGLEEWQRFICKEAANRVRDIVLDCKNETENELIKV